MFGLAGGTSAEAIAWVAVAVAIFAVLVALVLARTVFVIVPEYQRVVFFRFGRVISEARGPGLIFKFPIMDRVVKVNLRVEVVDIPSQAVITKDNVTIQVDAVIYFQVVEPIRAVIGVDNFRFASQRIAMTSLRSIIGRYELDSLLEHREGINAELRATIARHTTEWGVDVRQVEIRDITLPPAQRRSRDPKVPTALEDGDPGHRARRLLLRARGVPTRRRAVPSLPARRPVGRPSMTHGRSSMGSP